MAWVVGGIVFLAMIGILAGDAAASVWSVILYDGAVAGLIAACAALCGRWVMRPVWSRFDAQVGFRIATDTAAGFGVYGLIVLGLGLAGWLWTPLIVAVVVASALPGLWRLGAEQIGVWMSRPAGWGWILIIAAIPLALAATGATIPPGVLWGDEPHGYDVLEYHLEAPREWADAGKITLLDHNAFSAMPFNVEMLYLLAMKVRGGPWAGMYTAQFLHLMLIALAAVATLGIVRKDEPAGFIPLLACAATPWMTMLAPMAYNEGGLLLFGTIAVVLAVREKHVPWVVALYAGAFAGLAGGAKLTGVVLVACAIPVAWVVVYGLYRKIREESPARELIVRIPAFAIGIVLTLSPWLIHTAVWTGNPVWPEAMALLGSGKFSDAQVERWDAAHQPREDQRAIAARLHAGAEQIVLNWRYGYLLLPVGILAAIKAWKDPRAGALLVMVILSAGVWLFFTHLQGRFFVSAIPLLAMLMALVACRKCRIGIACYMSFQMAVGLWGTFSVMGDAAQERPGLWLRMQQYLSGPWAAGVGLSDFSAIQPERVVAALESDAPVILVGDAAAFLYPIPSSRLYYRTVFDVPADAPDAVNAWLAGIDPAIVKKAWKIISPSELERFHKTYHHIPPVPQGLGNELMVIAPGQPIPQ